MTKNWMVVNFSLWKLNTITSNATNIPINELPIKPKPANKVK